MSRGWLVRSPGSRKLVHVSVRNRVPRKTVAAMYRLYQQRVPWRIIEEKFPSKNGKPRRRGGIKKMFDGYGFKIRKQNVGCFKPDPKKTPAEIARMIEQATVFKVPVELRNEWREWPMERRKDFILRLRAKLKPDNLRPETPFSENIKPFDYWTDEAWEICRRLNVDANGKPLPSRLWKARLFPPSQGVIFEGQLWFWNKHTNRPGAFGAYFRGVWRPEDGRPALHRVLWERHNGRALRADEFVIHADDNYNNLRPENLTIITRGANAVRNHPYTRLKKDPLNAELKAKALKIRTAIMNSRRKKSQAAAALLLQRFNNTTPHDSNNDDHELVRHLAEKSGHNDGNQTRHPGLPQTGRKGKAALHA